ncbi:MAG TPA: hypothetical protein VM124_02235 [Candidatus Limnocylindrales bacterium]|nr:hypothetical protein [Candidatus Limnocylindrales bacterium]
MATALSQRSRRRRRIPSEITKLFSMLDHHLQRAIVYKLAFAPSMRFSELKPDVIENKLFTYHLKKVVAAGFVDKKADGSYELTPEGRRVGMRVVDARHSLADRAESVLFLVIRRAHDKAWLLYKRATHPLLGKVGFMHAIPFADETASETAHNTCKEKTGITGQFRQLGGGFFRVYNQGELESFTHFELLVCEDAQGELSQADERAEYSWHKNPDFGASDMLPNMQTLGELYQANKPFYIEERLDV